MKPIVKTSIIILSYTIFCLICCGVYEFSKTIPSSVVLPQDVFNYKLLNVFLLFTKLFPSICGTGILIGFSWSFQSKVPGLKRFSKIQLSNLKKILLVSFCSIFLCFLGKEVLQPIIDNKQASKETDARNYVEYIYYANYYKDLKDYNLAGFYTDNALKINPKSEAAINLAKEIEYENADYPQEEYDSLEEIALFVATYENNIESSQDQISYLLNKAKDFYDLQDYFNAHYYAIQAQYLSENGSLNFQKAQLLASDAWNKISSTENKYDKTLAELYAEKKRGYVALLEEDYITAYYIFDDLIKDDFNDNDILFYKNVAEHGLLNSTFFTDETENLRSFESSKNIYFTIKNADGTKDVIFIRGLTVLEDAGQLIQYFRNFSLHKFDSEGNFLKSITTPYAKMIAVPAYSFGEALDYTNIDKDGYVPYILLKSIDRHSSSVQVLPTYTFADSYKNKNPENAIFLELPYEDFGMLKQASKGQDRMSIFALFDFVDKASDYGYSSIVYSWALTTRITSPLFLMIVFIFLGLMAWNYRLLPGRVVAFRWIFTFPLINFILLIIFSLIEYFGNIFFFTLFSAIGSASMFVTSAILILGIFVISLMFLSSKGE